MNCFSSFKHWDLWFESHSRHGCLCVWVVLWVGSDLAMGWYPVQGVLPTVYKLRNWKSGQGPTKGCAYPQRSSLHEQCQKFSHTEIQRTSVASDSYSGAPASVLLTETGCSDFYSLWSSSVSPDKCQNSRLSYKTTASFHIHFNSLCTNHSSARRYEI
jgi:hypothetical protein